MKEFVNEMFSIDGNTAIEEIKTIVKEMRDLMFTIQSDVLKFYNVSTLKAIVTKPNTIR